jgi:hypothetical protein
VTGREPATSEKVPGDDPGIAAKLRIEELELEAGEQN